jgi:NAD(P)-dependent dehydrogenase (short-subunit alcohol dehydrogenase family)
MKTALVTGAAQGLGLVTATLLSQQGYCVILTDLQPVDAQVAALRDAGANAIGVSGDIAAESFVTELAARVARDHGAQMLARRIKTEMDVADQGSGAYSDADIIDRGPLARFARPQDVAEAIAFLCDSQRCSFINGVTLPVDGGWSADGSWDNLRLRTRPSSDLKPNPNPGP